MTLLLAGHETTATGLAWAFDLLLHAPAVHERASEGDAEYLDAVVKETLRLRPVIPGVGRVVRERAVPARRVRDPAGRRDQPFDPHDPPPRATSTPTRRRFAPSASSVDDAPDTYTWIPFGGGTRRCLGASFALMEMRIVLRRVLERCALRPGDPELAEVQFRGITQAPRNGALRYSGPRATGRLGSVIHSLQEPAYSAAG